MSDNTQIVQYAGPDGKRAYAYTEWERGITNKPKALETALKFANENDLIKSFSPFSIKSPNGNSWVIKVNDDGRIFAESGKSSSLVLASIPIKSSSGTWFALKVNDDGRLFTERS
ncbi:hypothetical protein [Fructobacillus fructosus]|uniref:hypothetical protein n=1 Tax=Fructobacillus fructosus TaxID=1631 RepID=UPI001658C10C|nr:hypothetical protein [Fructobacillus fructosus]MBC9119383.1 hypothetical protein [Fructobacillus fructosus]MBD9366842.1 hypothetical protein [Leuconostoc mesenteroides]